MEENKELEYSTCFSCSTVSLRRKISSGQFASEKSELVLSGIEKLANARVVVQATKTRRGPSPGFDLIMNRTHRNYLLSLSQQLG